MKSTVLSALAGLALAAAPAVAGTFDIKGADVTKGETEIAVGAAFFKGFPLNADLLRSSAVVGLSYGFTDRFKAGVSVGFDKLVGGDFEAVTVGAEVQAVLRKGEGRSPTIAWFTGVDFGVASGVADVATFGPLWQWSLDDKTSLTVNTLFQRSFGEFRSEGTDFAYAWQVKREVREGFSVGVEGYGVLPTIGHTPGLDFQEHRIGPVLYFERSLARSAAPAKISMKDAKGDAGKDADGGHKLNVEMGLLFGLTDATQNTTLRLKGAITF